MFRRWEEPYRPKEIASALVIGASYGGAALATGLGFTAGTLGFGLVAGAGAIGITTIGSSVLGLTPESPDLSEFAAKAQGYLVNKQANDAFIPVVYGSRRVGGTIVFMEQSGYNNKYLNIVLPISEGEIDGISTVYLNDVDATEGSQFYHDGRWWNTIQTEVGTDLQAANASLVSEITDWTTDHRLRGTAYIYAKLEFDSSGKSYPQGQPVITADVKGVKVYDPRTLTTAWSDNPALCIRDFLTNTRYGRGIETSQIDDTTFISAANYCDETVTHPSTDVSANAFISRLTWEDGIEAGVIGSDTLGTVRAGEYITVSGWSNSANNGTYYVTYAVPPNSLGIAVIMVDRTSGAFVSEGEPDSRVAITMAHSLKRYTCNGVVDTQQGSIDILNKLLSSCRGLLVFSGGKYKLIIDKPETAGFAFTEDNIVGAWSISLGNKKNQYNRVRAGFYNAHRQWQSDVAVIDSSTFRADDNGLLLEKEMELPFTSNNYTAQQIATINLNQSRQMITCEFTATIEAMRCEVGDVVTITHSTPAWSAKEFRVLSLRLTQNGEVSVVAVEYDSTVYNFTLNEVDATPNTNLPNPSTVVAPTNLAWTLDAHYFAGFGRLSWTASADVFVDRYKLLIEADDYVSGSKTAAQIAQVSRSYTVRSTEFTLSDLPVGDYTATLTAINTLGVSSDSISVSFTIVTPPMPQKVTGLELDLGKDGQGNGTEWTGKDCKIKWQPAAYYMAFEIDELDEGADTGSLDWYHKDYEVKVYNGSTLLRTEYVTDTWYIYSYEKNAEDAAKNSATPYRELSFQVRARGKQNQVSAVPAIL